MTKYVDINTKSFKRHANSKVALVDSKSMIPKNSLKRPHTRGVHFDVYDYGADVYIVPVKGYHLRWWY